MGRHFLEINASQCDFSHFTNCIYGKCVVRAINVHAPLTHVVIDILFQLDHLGVFLSVLLAFYTGRLVSALHHRIIPVLI